MKIKIVQPQDDTPKSMPTSCHDCGKHLPRDEDGDLEDDGIETCSYENSYLLLCADCYVKRGNSVR